MNILFATSEAYPLVKTGGLADVCGQLPRALNRQDVTIRIIMPAYAGVVEKAKPAKLLGHCLTSGYRIAILESRLPGTQIKVWLLSCPELYEREGGPYQNNDGEDFQDNALRFGVFARCVVAITMGWTEISWPIDVVHCHDWQAGLIPALLRLHSGAPPSLFTIHNLAYQGLFPYSDFEQLELPPHFWSHHGLEFYNQLSFIKGGIVFADKVNTVSPRYANEITTPEFGCGLDGLLRNRGSDLSGILNGIDVREWNPGTDPNLVSNYNRHSLAKKSANKLELQSLFGLPQDPDIPVFSLVTRLTHQKGIDLVIDAMAMLRRKSVQFTMLGTGDRKLETQLRQLARRRRKSIGIKIAYDEAWAHKTVGGADAFLMPSRFEPCGLTQLYSLRYGTLPIVRNIGGLANTVTHASPENLKNGTATGFTFNNDTAGELKTSIESALTLYKNKTQWQAVQLAGMKQDFSWNCAAQSYTNLYKEIIKTRHRRLQKNAAAKKTARNEVNN